MKHARESKLAERHGGWTEWLREIDMSTSQADRFIKVFKEYDAGKLPHVGNIAFRALYEIATLPPEQREQPHTTATGEQKTPDEMTVKELRELKRQLKQTEQERDAERKERERLERETDKPAKIKQSRS